MELYKNRRFWTGAILSSILFTSLIFYRVAFYNGTLKNSRDKGGWSYKSLKSDESWMSIFQNFKKIGFTYRRLENMGSSYHIHEETVMKINTMGMAQEIHVDSKSTTDMDFAVKTFDFKVVSGSFNFSVTGEIKGSTLYVESSDKIVNSGNHADTSRDKKHKPLEIPLENRPYLTSGIIQATLASGLKKDQEMVLFVFDPSTLGQAPATVKMEGRENIATGGKRVTARKVSLSFKGAKQFAWVDDDGQVLKEQGLLGITLVKTDRKGAIEGAPLEESDDLTRLVSVKSNKIFDAPERLKSLTVKVSGIGDENSDGKSLDSVLNRDSLNEGRQKWSDEVKNKNIKQLKNLNDKSYVILTIEKESLEGLPEKLAPDDLAAIDNKFKQPDAFIQSNDHRIKSFAFKAISMPASSTSVITLDSSSTTPIQKVEKLVEWIQKNIRRQPVLSLPNALSTLENRIGDCNEHAALLAAFCRAIGIPAKIEAGLVYLNGSFYYHAWNSVFIGRWITVDALFNQIPADVTHIAFSSGSQDIQLDIVGLIGRVQIEVLDYRQ